jgi:hypothetical protein
MTQLRIWPTVGRVSDAAPARRRDDDFGYPTAELAAVSAGDLDTGVGGRASAPSAPGKLIGALLGAQSEPALAALQSPAPALTW